MYISNSYVFKGETVDGLSQFVVDPFTQGTEKVYLNGSKLVRSIDYSTGNSGNVSLMQLDTIILDPSKYPDGATELSVLEVVLEYYVVQATDVTLNRILSDLDDIKTATMGSWNWDKRLGVLTTYDVNGVEKFKFNVKDSAENASRERRKDLETEIQR